MLHNSFAILYHKIFLFLYKIFKIKYYPFLAIKRKDKINMNTLLKTTNLCKYFGKQKAINNISLNVEKNSVHGLLGPNGAGKSTTLKMITGILKPTSGNIEFNGHMWTRKDLNKIGALIEMPPLYENLTAHENLKVRTTILGLPDSRIDEVLQTVSLTDTGKKRAGQFSLGMKQRLGIAIALLNNPKLLILDEPTNGLDPVGIEELRELIRSFPDKGITVILSSHILSEVQQTANHIGIIANGMLGYEGKLDMNVNLEQLFMDIVSNDELGNYIDILAQNITFDKETKIPLSKKELGKIDFYGKNSEQKREQWFYKDIYEIYGTDKTEAVAVNINNQYYIAKRQ